MNDSILPVVNAGDISQRRLDPVDAETIEQVSMILRNVEYGGTEALQAYALKFGDRRPGQPLVLPRSELTKALSSLGVDRRLLLQRTADRIYNFAQDQRAALGEVDVAVEGGRAGHRLIPVDTAGCYAPGGRFPLPSTVLMTAVTARAAGVSNVWVASPRPSTMTLAAAAVAGADNLLAVGGAQAIAAMAFGVGDIPRCDVIVGPGNRWVTAAKQLVAGKVAIDMVAGPSELVVLADNSAEAETVALDLLAQAEHDTDALPVLVTPSEALAQRVRELIDRFLEETPTPTAEEAVRRGFTVLVQNIEEGVRVCNSLAPEHLELNLSDPDKIIPSLKHYGALFIGSKSAEVLGDYGTGPNHVLPTAGAARHTGGLSVLNFLRFPTWLRIDDVDEASNLIDEAAALARLEGLEWHARAAEKRRSEK